MKTLTYALIFVLLAAMYFVGFFVAKHKYSVINTALLPSSAPERMGLKPIGVYKDTQGAMHYVYPSDKNKFTKNELKESPVILPYLDSVAKALDIKTKQIESTTNINTHTEADSIPFLKKQIDSLKRLVFYYSDKQLKLTVRPGSTTDTLDKGSFDFAYDADLKINQYFKRKKFLGLNIGSKQHYTDISSNDPRTTIGGLSTLSVKQNMPSVGFRFQAVTSYSFLTQSLSPGVGFRFDLSRFSLNGIYYYNTKEEQWRPVLSLRYDIIQF
jgi:hypothetical protein